MTERQFLDYWVVWIRRTDPEQKVEVDYAAATVTMARHGILYRGRPVQCGCNDEQCLGWTMVTKQTPLS